MPRLGKLPGYTTGIHLFLRVRACFSLFHSVPFLGHVLCLRRINGTPANTLKPPETRSGNCKTPIVGSIPTPASNLYPNVFKGLEAVSRLDQFAQKPT